ncbi:MAG TPA: trehalase family glycosidase [Aggregatilineales bacterium]|nr:trehalase family glycosidase [Aggregatilineales bacterium]
MSTIEALQNRIDLTHIPFTDRGSRLLLFRDGNSLSIRLAERWTKWENEVGHYRQRPPIVSRLTLLNADGYPLDFDVDTYPHVVRMSTAAGHFAWTFIDPETLLVRLPAGRHGFAFNVQGEQGQKDRRGGTLHGKRNFAYTTNARITENTIQPTADSQHHVRILLDAGDSDGLLLNITPRLGYNRSIPVPDTAIADSRRRWEAWFSAAPPVLDKYRDHYAYAWWVMRSGLLNTRYFFSREALVPSKIHYVGVWQWDQYFHAIAYRHVDTHLAEDQIRILLDHQRADGMFPDAIHDEGLVTHLAFPVEADVTKPPLMAWAVLKVFEKSGHLDFLQECYEPLVRGNNWWLTYNRDEATGLSMYRHPFSSGLDDSPLWDQGMPVVAPDLNTYICIQQESLAQIADLIGLPDEARRYRAMADDLALQMQKMLWNEETGVFNALYQGQSIATLTPFSLLPLWTGRLPRPLRKRLLSHLTDPNTFWVNWPLPTVAVSDPKFDPAQMWRGPTWTNINYLFVEALARLGENEVAAALRRKTLDLVLQHNDVYEYYNPLTAEPPPKAASMYGWTCAVFIDLAIQETRLLEAGDAGLPGRAGST